VLLLKVNERYAFFIRLEPDLARLATPTRTLGEVTQYLHDGGYVTTAGRDWKSWSGTRTEVDAWKSRKDTYEVRRGVRAFPIFWIG
jgi:hypothetical protein